MKKSTLLLIAVFLVFMLLLATSGAHAQSPLATTAASMQPGEWKQLPALNWDGSIGPLPCQAAGGLGDGPPCFPSGILSPRFMSSIPDVDVSISDYITQYADSAGWAMGRLTFVGQAHGANSAGQTVVYDEATNMFSYGPWPKERCQYAASTAPAACFGHGYDHTTADPLTGDVYAKTNGSRMVHKWAFGATEWTKLPDVPTQSYDFGGSLKFVPGFGLVWLDTDWGVFKCAMPCDTADDWSLIANTTVNLNSALPTVGAVGWSDYSAPHKMLLFGNSDRLWTLDVAGNFVKRANPPALLGINRTLQTIDPVTGHLLALAGHIMYQYSIPANLWTQVQTTIPFSNPGDGAVEVSIPEYGVMMFLKYYGSPVWLYKHSGSGDPLPPPFEPPAMPPTPTPADWLTRSTAPGVVRAVGFDQAGDIAGRYGNATGLFVGSATTATLDTAFKASGASSLKFVIPGNTDANAAGAYFANFSDDLQTQFSEGETFYYQWQQRLSPEMMQAYPNAGGWKHAIVGTGDRAGGFLAPSCTELELVMNRYGAALFPILYNSCTGSNSHGAYDGLYKDLGGGIYALQNALPNCTTADMSGCAKYAAEEWMTFQVAVYVGKRVGNEWVDSWVRMWVGREGEASTLALDFGPYALSAGALADKFGKIWLTPFNTGKDPSQAHPTATTWYDNLIISRNRIADPVTSTTPPPDPDPAPSITLTANPSTILAGESSTLTWASANATSVSISPGFGSVPLNGTGNAELLNTTTFTATATGAGGTASSSATVTVNQPVPPQPGDIVAPSVSFKTADGTTFSGNTKTIEFRASDNVGAVLCEPTVNGIKIQAAPIFTEGAKLPATVKFYLQQATIPKGTYILGVSCKDAAGNIGTAQTISVTRK